MIKNDRVYDLLLYLCLPTLYFLLWTFLGSISQPNLTSFDNLPKIILIDSADYLNINASNALLKLIEVPKKNIYLTILSINI